MEIQLLPLALQEIVKSPSCRGQFTKQDSAETQFGLISAGNGEGKLYLLVEPSSFRVEKAKFLSFGKMSSILALEAYCLWAAGKTVAQLCHVSLGDLTEEINVEEGFDIQMLRELGGALQVALSTMVVEAPIIESVENYRRKDKEHMSDLDLKWLPLSAPQKIALIEPLLSSTLLARTKLPLSAVSLYNVQMDLVVKLKFEDVVDHKERPLVMRFVESTLQAELHPEIRVEEYGQ